MRILVDADACPGRDIIEKVAKKYKIDIIMFCDINHVLKSNYSIIKYVDHGFQSVDMALINEAKKEDIIITQDFGVAAMALGKKAKAINPKGYIFSDSNIDRMLFERHVSGKMRRAGKKNNSGPRKRNFEDDVRLEKNLIKLIIQ
ncbi:YaiI/YqxD family protein [Clostridium sp. Marseille-Q2269]|uniref:YaiI/YqxD family protein n=1 Tax=Clostridium sp. Marseille-Q2269 TaxID=2942205 RepID=UPI0020735E4F|nr:YaiI/YqxD family protein [Clostridium sp. Marseille-Q2269]